MMEIGIDELNFVLQPVHEDVGDDLGLFTWPDIATHLIGAAADALGFGAVFGPARELSKRPAGYGEALTYGCHGFYLAAAYNPGSPSQGVLFTFSAQALAWWRERTDREVWELMQLVQRQDLYTVRVSRIDLTADFLDEGMRVQAIYDDLLSGDLIGQRRQIGKGGTVQLRAWDWKPRGYFSNGEARTVYLGSQAKNTGGFLRVYDKRSEQIETKGAHLDKAQACADWVRLEARLSGKNAHSFGYELERCASTDEMKHLIAHVFTDRYTFRDTASGTLAPWSASLAAVAGNPSAVLLSVPSTRNHDLAAKLDHVADSSGLISLLHRVRGIWGDDAPELIMAYLLAFADGRAPTRETRAWVSAYGDVYRQDFATINHWLLAEAAAA